MTPTLPDPHHPTSEELFAFRDGELTADRRALIEAHVMACAQCTERLEEMSAAEAELRLRPDGAGEEYFERMTESVMARIGVAGLEARAPSDAVSESGRELAPGSAAGSAAGAGKRRGGYIDVPRIDRRRPDTATEDHEPRRRLHLPWIGIAGSTAAAVAVVIVAVVLFRGQSEWLRAPRPAVVGEPRSAVRADSTLAKVGGAAGDAARNESAAPPASSAREKMVQSKKKSDRVLAKSVLETSPPPVAEDRAEERFKDQGTHLRGGAASGVTAPETGAQRKIAVAPQASSGEVSQNVAPPAESGEYGNLLRAFRLPPVWNPNVPSGAVARAENDLRYLYQTGKAGADSARIRLYLAEAERARLTDPSNTAAVESISHHYRRAISLAGGDAVLASTARRRLAEFEQEMTRARGAQP